MFSINQTLTVTELNEIINETLASQQVSVQGEVSDFKKVREKYIYFDLKDETSKISCFMMSFALRTPLEDGMSVKITGRAGVYVPYGKLTFRVESVEAQGEGALARALALTREKLTKEGLFDAQYKKQLPRFPQKIGIITSESAAAYTDVIRILRNRWAGLEIFLRPSLVQGSGTEEEVISALNYFNSFHPVDVIILTRGGGSLEDLMAFNSEGICRAVFASKIPVIVAIGHERDETLVELVADVRASTPSNAAEIAVPDKDEWIEKLYERKKQMRRSISENLAIQRENLAKSRENLQKVFEHIVKTKKEESKQFCRLLLSYSPTKKILSLQEKIAFLSSHIDQSFLNIRLQRKNKVREVLRILANLDPKKPLKHGYSLSFSGGKLLRKVSDAVQGSEMQTQLADGKVISVVK